MDSLRQTINKKVYIIAAAVLLAVLAFGSYTINHELNKNKLTSDQKIINEYIIKNIDSQKIVSASMEMISDFYYKKADYTLDKIKAQHETLKNCKKTIETDSELLQPLKKIYTDEYNTVDSLFVFVESNYGEILTKEDIYYINSLGAKEKEICAEKNKMYVELLKNSNLKYTISADGIINYEIKE
ncbi:MAG: hypothetical protein ACM3X7_07385 [Solirubrobacterales bacterium]